MRHALTGAKIFDGTKFREGAAVILDGSRIELVVAERLLGASMARTELNGGLLAPGFIDVQVNGGGGALLNGEPSVDTVKRIAASHRRFGTTSLLPTVITDTQPVLEHAVVAVRKAIAESVPGVIGIHIEGPFLDPRRKGAHRSDLIRLMGEADAAWLAAAGCGVVMTTVAPEAAPVPLIRKLANAGVIVSLGHTDCDSAAAFAAFAAGARGVTHLYNAMSQLGHRRPGMVGAALADPQCYCSIIADGFHVDPVALRAAMAAKRNGRLMLISDAMPTAAGGPDRFELQGREVKRANGRLELADGTLAGSDLTMDAAVRYVRLTLLQPYAEALRMGSLYPARFLRLDRELGRIAPGYRANLVHLNDAGEVLGTWIDGQSG